MMEHETRRASKFAQRKGSTPKKQKHHPLEKIEFLRGEEGGQESEGKTRNDFRKWRGPPHPDRGLLKTGEDETITAGQVKERRDRRPNHAR